MPPQPPQPHPPPEFSDGLSIVDNCGEYRAPCGYCSGAGSGSADGGGGAETSVSVGMWAHRLAPSTYGLLLSEAGWRRSGRWLYRPDAGETCCVPHTIRLDARAFEPSRAQRKAESRLRAFENGGRGGGRGGGGDDDEEMNAAAAAAAPATTASFAAPFAGGAPPIGSSPVGGSPLGGTPMRGNSPRPPPQPTRASERGGAGGSAFDLPSSSSLLPSPLSAPPAGLGDGSTLVARLALARALEGATAAVPAAVAAAPGLPTSSSSDRKRERGDGDVADGDEEMETALPSSRKSSSGSLAAMLMAMDGGGGVGRNRASSSSAATTPRAATAAAAAASSGAAFAPSNETAKSRKSPAVPSLDEDPVVTSILEALRRALEALTASGKAPRGASEAASKSLSLSVPPQTATRRKRKSKDNKMAEPPPPPAAASIPQGASLSSALPLALAAAVRKASSRPGAVEIGGEETPSSSAAAAPNDDAFSSSSSSPAALAREVVLAASPLLPAGWSVSAAATGHLNFVGPEGWERRKKKEKENERKKNDEKLAAPSLAARRRSSPSLGRPPLSGTPPPTPAPKAVQFPSPKLSAAVPAAPAAAAATAAAAAALAPPPAPRRRRPLRIVTLPLPEAAERVAREEFALFRSYQTRHHGEAPEQVTREGFVRFLVDTPLARSSGGEGAWRDDDGENLDGDDGDAARGGARDLFRHGTGTYHQQYYLGDRLVAVGVVDVVPQGLSSVYCFWDPSLKGLALGRVVALREIAAVAALAEMTEEKNRTLAAPAPSAARAVAASPSPPALSIVPRHYFMGYYIHSCPKMRYKAEFEPSELRCNASGRWVPAAAPVVTAALDADARAAIGEIASFSSPKAPEQQPRAAPAAASVSARALALNTLVYLPPRSAPPSSCPAGAAGAGTSPAAAAATATSAAVATTAPAKPPSPPAERREQQQQEQQLEGTSPPSFGAGLFLSGGQQAQAQQQQQPPSSLAATQPQPQDSSSGGQLMRLGQLVRVAGADPAAVGALAARLAPWRAAVGPSCGERVVVLL